jgi:hypothetical protein
MRGRNETAAFQFQHNGGIDLDSVPAGSGSSLPLDGGG